MSRILVVEDVQETREAMTALLRRDGYRVDPAQDENDAVERARWHRPDLVLISLSSKVDQETIAREIRARAGLSSDIPVVIFPMHTIPEGAEEQMGGNIYATLPDNFDQLRGLLRRVLHGSFRKH